MSVSVAPHAPSAAILIDQFLAEVRGLKHKNVAALQVFGLQLSGARVGDEVTRMASAVNARFGILPIIDFARATAAAGLSG